MYTLPVRGWNLTKCYISIHQLENHLQEEMHFIKNLTIQEAIPWVSNYFKPSKSLTKDMETL